MGARPPAFLLVAGLAVQFLRLTVRRVVQLLGLRSRVARHLASAMVEQQRLPVQQRRLVVARPPAVMHPNGAVVERFGPRAAKSWEAAALGGPQQRASAVKASPAPPAVAAGVRWSAGPPGA